MLDRNTIDISGHPGDWSDLRRLNARVVKKYVKSKNCWNPDQR